MKILLVGYGSIGRRHHEVLLSINDVNRVDIVTKQRLSGETCFTSIEGIDSLDVYDYFIIASETAKHYEQLKTICSKVSNKKILVEKPLFDKNYKGFRCQNKVFVAYNLRFHPIIQKLKALLNNERVLHVNVITGQYLPTWRPDQNYRQSYSADLSQGGGVLRDLSHELDYIYWLFGEFIILKAINTKISDLEIQSDDIFTALCKNSTGTIINVTMDYISKVPLRKIVIHTEENTILANLISNTLEVYTKEGIKHSVELPTVDRNYTYRCMHSAIMKNKTTSISTYSDGLYIVNIINNIQGE